MPRPKGRASSFGMVDFLNIAAAVLTIAFGAFGFLAPRFTLDALDLKPTDSNMGLSEMRASVGGLFVITGLFALMVPQAVVFAMLGVAYSGAALGRLISLMLDSPPRGKLLVFFGIEAALAGWLLAANSHAFG